MRQPVAATRMLIRGLSRLKKQYGRYVNVGMPSTVDWVMPHVYRNDSDKGMRCLGTHFYYFWLQSYIKN